MTGDMGFRKFAFQFSLRTFLFVFTVLAMILAVVAITRFQRQEFQRELLVLRLDHAQDLFNAQLGQVEADKSVVLHPNGILAVLRQSADISSRNGRFSAALAWNFTYREGIDRHSIEYHVDTWLRPFYALMEPQDSDWQWTIAHEIKTIESRRQGKVTTTVVYERR